MILNGGLAIAVAKNIVFAKTWPMPEREFAAMAMPSDLNASTTYGSDNTVIKGMDKI